MPRLNTVSPRSTRLLLLLGAVPLTSCGPVSELPGADTATPGPVGDVEALRQSEWFDTITSRIQASQYRFEAQAHGVVGFSPELHLTTLVDGDGTLVRAEETGDEIALRFSAWGREGELVSTSVAKARLGDCYGSGELDAEGLCLPRAERTHAGGVTEWWTNRSVGLEQGWSLTERPDGAGPILLEIQVDGANVQPGTDLDAVTLESDGRMWSYAGVEAWDANGQSLPAFMEAEDGMMRIVVDDLDATWPIEVDPTLTTAGITLSGTTNSDRFGYALANAGDVNNDGYEDVIVGVPNFSKGQTDEGGVFIYKGGSTGLDTTAIMSIESNAAGDRLGASVAGDGKLDGDALDDCVAGAPGANSGKGSIEVIQGAAAPSVGQTIAGVVAGEAFGTAVAIGNINGAGTDEIVVGAPLGDPVSADEGRFYVVDDTNFFGNPAASLTKFDGATTGAKLGAAVAVARGSLTLNDDALGDVIVGSPGDSSSKGLVTIYPGNATLANIATGAVTRAGATAGDEFGATVASSTLSMTEDGAKDFTDIAVGAPGVSSSAGATYVFTGTGTSSLVSASGTTFAGAATSRAGSSLAFGDANKDGYADLAVGSPKYDGGQTDEGRAQYFSGGAASPDTTVDWAFESNEAGAEVGSAVALSDVTKDGLADVFVGAWLADAGGTDRGAVYGFYGDSDGDGKVLAADCDDTNAAIYDGATEVVANGIDEDCDGTDLCYVDADKDSFGTSAGTTVADNGDKVCLAANGEADDKTDCQDTGTDAKFTFIGAAPLTNALQCLQDVDGDDYGALVPTGTGATAGNDCLDTDTAYKPGASETAYGIDKDCDNNFACYTDADQDGFGTAVLVEEADGDKNCDEPLTGVANDSTDCQDTGTDAKFTFIGAAPLTNAAQCLQDVDGDNYGAKVPTGTGATAGDDCLDTDSTYRPGASETTYGVDKDCDNNFACYTDADQDGFGTSTLVEEADGDKNCDEPLTGVANDNTDCQDTGTDAKFTFIGAAPLTNATQCLQDVDGDDYGAKVPTGTGATAGNDCLDTDTSYKPGAAETTYNVDKDCDNNNACYTDADQDGFGTAVLVEEADGDKNCDEPLTGVANDSTDCQDTGTDAKFTFIGAAPLTNATQCLQDVDGDNYGAKVPTGTGATAGDDCLDTDSTYRPGASETTYGVDKDCDGNFACYTDADQDGSGTSTLVEESDGDKNCDEPLTSVANDNTDCQDTGTDAKFTFVGAAPLTNASQCLQDVDGDDYGAKVPTGTGATAGNDCLDTDTTYRPGAAETAYGLDKDCDNNLYCYTDADFDGYGSTVLVEEADGDKNCDEPATGVANDSTDCLDTDNTAYPTRVLVAIDVNDGVDNDCTGSLDECYHDGDDDNFGTTAIENAFGGAANCAGTQAAIVSTDCLDSDPTAFPGHILTAADVADGANNDCDAGNDEECFHDGDNDDYGTTVVENNANGDTDCLDANEAIVSTDCDDGRLLTNPGVIDTCGNGIDDDCNAGTNGAGASADDDGDGVSYGKESTVSPAPSNDCNDDSDNDGVLDGLEFGGGASALNTDLTSPPDIMDTDDDDDGLLTSVEDTNKNLNWMDDDADGDTIPNFREKDSDGDGIADSVEDVNKNGVYNVGVETNAWSKDTDADGILDGLEDRNFNGTVDANESNPRSTDSDGDGVLDKLEDVNLNGLKDSGEMSAFSNDSDADGILDGVEDGNKDGNYDIGPAETNPLSNDTDGDTILDGAEDADKNGVVASTESDPRSADSDGDGVLDKLEDVNKNGVWDAPTETSAYKNDSDADGILDGEEDANKDGLVSANESNPRQTDSDSDGVLDKLEDVNLNGVRDPGEMYAYKNDSDGDGILDGVEDGNKDGNYDAGPAETDPLSNDTDGDGIFDGLEDQNKDGAVSANESNPRSTDSDGDGVLDKLEDVNLNGLRESTEMYAYKNDSDSDGILDGVEDGNNDGNYDPGVTETNPLSNDTDGDGILDGLEDANRDGLVGVTESNPRSTDTDGDGVLDKLEDVNLNGVRDGTEMYAYKNDSDGDGILDGVEDGNKDGNYDPGVTETNPLSNDTDSDGILDALEDINKDGIVSSGESNPRSTDSDGDGVLDKLEDSNLNGLRDSGEMYAYKNDSDGDGILDGVEDGNKDGNYDPGPTETDPLSNDTDSDGILDALEDINKDGIVSANESNPRSTDSDGDGVLDKLEDVNLNGLRDSGEMYAYKNDSDGDGVLDGVEDGNKDGNYDPGPTETNPLSNDTDGDTILDGLEDSNKDGIVGSTESDPRSTDTDGDGVLDKLEDANLNGVRDATEMYTYKNDSDGDGILDGVEDGNKDGNYDPGPTETNPLSNDTDSDGILDNLEDANKDGIVGPTESNPRSTDTDSDGVLDKLEDVNLNGVRDAGEMYAYKNDSDSDGILDGVEDGNKDGNYDVGPAETNPLSNDTDGDGIFDATEDINKDGIVGASESNPRTTDSDSDGVLDQLEDVNLNGVRDAGEMYAYKNDSDADGVLDGVEDANKDGNYDTGPETDALNVDTDADTINDGIEDQDKDGVVDPTETNPRVKDTDGDGIVDNIEDANKNGKWDSASETQGYAKDTDGDTLEDGFEDANKNGVMDTNEPDPRKADTDGDGLVDQLDTSIDTDGDGTLNWRDVDDDADTVLTANEDLDKNGLWTDDTDADGKPNHLDNDDDGDTILTKDEDANKDADPRNDDADADGKANYLDTDSDADGWSDAIEAPAGVLVNTDGDLTAGGKPNSDYIDTDSDADGVLDAFEAKESNGSQTDTDGDAKANRVDNDDDGDSILTGNGVLNEAFTSSDTDNDSIPNYLDADDDNDGIGTLYEREQFNDESGVPNLCGYLVSHLDPDSDDDNVLDGAEWSGLEKGTKQGADKDPRDSDGDGCVNSLDDDDDNDSIPTVIEGGEGSQFDVDGDPTKNCAAAPDGLPNYLDDDSDGDKNDNGAVTKDTKSNGPDGSEIYESDRDEDGIPDVLDCNDSDGCDGDPDGDKLTNCEERLLGSNGASPDSDGDGLSDGVEVGDLAFPENTDGDLTWEDADKDGVIDGGKWVDTNKDGNIDASEYTGSLWNDKDKDGRVDSGEGEVRQRYDLIDADDDGDHVPTATEIKGDAGAGTGTASNPADNDGDGTFDYHDSDDDNDGIPSVDEEPLSPDNDPTNDDSDGDGIADFLDNNPCNGGNGDCDGDGLTNGEEDDLGLNPDSVDSDGDGEPDDVEWCRDNPDCNVHTRGEGEVLSDPADSDGDSTPDVLDTDDDNDGLSSAEEGDVDVDGDGLANSLDDDSDGDGILDKDESLTADDDCDGSPDLFDADATDGPCVQDPRINVEEPTFPDVPACACQSTSNASFAAWGVLLGLVGLLRRRQK